MVQHPKTGGEHLKGGHGVPETTNTKEGSASRNIQRKSDHNHGKEKKQGGGGMGGKGDWDPIKDGSM
eukprot:CAMPEP_0201135668 /NCGR_PEP_ID=MMETSP0850-20130426/54444_1 /ASSEMBLY_ACC=CAM_ASM_000622 /TAXON_ID=183588 /ORGANISM="Pseudo-nitzschia fraudulenta, Strain WWA7" /LENGTH=66 /DNA_ID=CAMNT_0047406861 /DNA_START=486 /DNA_END=686 /DNA_ORIENTATION=-